MHHHCNLQHWTLSCWRCLFAAGLFQKQFSKTSSSDPPSMNSTQGIIWSILSIGFFFKVKKVNILVVGYKQTWWRCNFFDALKKPSHMIFETILSPNRKNPHFYTCVMSKWSLDKKIIISFFCYILCHFWTVNLSTWFHNTRNSLISK